MSEQTPNSSEDLNGVEPSMEDILASIRKIISDDEPVAMESPEDAASITSDGAPVADDLDNLMQGIEFDTADLTSDAVLDAAVTQSDAFAAKGESVDLNIDDVLDGLDDDVLEFEAKETSAFESNSLDADTLIPSKEALDVSEALPGADEDILAVLDMDIPLEAETLDAAVEAPDIVQELVAADDDIEMDALLDDILMSPDDVEAEDVFDDTAIETGFSTDASSGEETSDLDLVKSLIADLSDEPASMETDEELEALLTIPEVEEEAPLAIDEQSFEADVEPEITATEPEPEEDILGDILDMTIEDELESHPEDIETDDLTSLDSILDAEQENLAENSIEVEGPAPEAPHSVDDLPSLSEIAAAAEADAVAFETVQASPVVTAGAGLSALAAGGAAALGATALSSASGDTETETTDTNIQTHSTQENSMPVKAVKTDAILDDVTETATAGAFAELNQVVEDKAIFNERGPRIGDLVQEALRPMLKEWLDANLKGIVERAVTKEVKRISSGK